MGFIETLQGSAREDSRAQTQFLGVMKDEAERMNRLVGDLLSLSRVESDQRVRPNTEIALLDVLEGTLNALQPIGRTRAQVQLSLNAPDDRVQMVGDADQLRQVFTNLVENAIKYGASGERVDIDVTRVTRDPSLRQTAVRIDVTDFGPGIDPLHLPRLTERFYRADNHRNRDAGGTGLGLAIVKTHYQSPSRTLESGVDLGEGRDIHSSFADIRPFSRITRSKAFVVIKLLRNCHKSIVRTAYSDVEAIKGVAIAQTYRRLHVTRKMHIIRAGPSRPFARAPPLHAIRSRLPDHPLCCLMPPSWQKPLERILIFRHRLLNPAAPLRASSAFAKALGKTRSILPNASRQIKSGEVEVCTSNGVTDFIEVRVGYDGIVFASDITGNTFEFTPSDWFLALSREISVDGKMVANPNTNWKQVNASFPRSADPGLCPWHQHMAHTRSF